MRLVPVLLTIFLMSPQDRKAEWTVMVYLSADCDLEAPMMEDLKEMVAAGSTPDVNVVVLADRHPKGDGQYSKEGVANLQDWTTAKLLHVQAGKLREIEDLGERNLGDPATLRDFAVRVASEFPARKFALIMSDHGMSWPGACADETDKHDFLTLAEIAGALADVTKTTGRLELIGFDACLMGNLEVAHAVAPFGNVLVASEELEPGFGWHFTPLLDALGKKPSMDGAALGRVICDTFRDFFAKHKEDEIRREGHGITLGVIALDRVAAVAKAVDALAAACDARLREKGREAWLQVARARAAAEEYGKDGNPPQSSFFVHDLAHLAQGLKAELGIAQADALAKAVQDAVVYRVRGPARPNSSGLSVFFPPDAETLKRHDLAGYADTAFAKAGAWNRFLADYAETATRDTTQPDVRDVATDDAEVDKDDVVTITSSVAADDIDEAYFVLAMQEGDEHVVIGTLPTDVGEDGKLKEEWDGQWFTIKDKETEFICPVTGLEVIDEKAGTYFVQVPAQVRLEGEEEWTDVTLYFELTITDKDVKGALVYVFEFTKFGPLDIDLEEGDALRPVYLTVAADGSRKFVASDDEEDVLKVEDAGDITIGWGEVPDGTYHMGFVVTDFAGNAAEEYVKVEKK